MDFHPHNLVQEGKLMSSITNPNEIQHLYSNNSHDFLHTFKESPPDFDSFLFADFLGLFSFVIGSSHRVCDGKIAAILDHQ